MKENYITRHLNKKDNDNSDNLEIQGLKVVMPTKNLEKIEKSIEGLRINLDTIKSQKAIVQKVEVTNPISNVDLIASNNSLRTAMEVLKSISQEANKLLETISKKDTQVNVAKSDPPPTNITVNNLPTGQHKDNPKTADPSVYVPVRLTDGDRFYKALDTIMTAVGGGGGGNSATQYAVINSQVKVAVSSTPVALAASQTFCRNGVIIQALSANNALVFVGDHGVSAGSGFELDAGQAVSVAIADLGKLFVNGTAGDGVCFITSV